MKKIIILLLAIGLLTACTTEQEDVLPTNIDFDEEVDFGNLVIGISHDHSQIAVLEDGKFKVIDTVSLEVVSEERLNKDALAAIKLKPNVRWSPNGKFILITSPYDGVDIELRFGQNSDVYMYDIEEEDMDSVIEVEPFDFSDNNNIVYAPTWMPDGNIAYLELNSYGTKIKTFDLTTEDTRTLYKEKDRSVTLADLIFLDDLHLVFSEQPTEMNKKKKIILYDIEQDDTMKVASSNAEVLRIENYNLSKRLLVIAHNSTGSYNTQHHTKTLEIITFDKKFETFETYDYDDHNVIMNGALSPNGTYLLSAIKVELRDPEEKIYVVFDIESKKEVLEIEVEGTIGYEGSYLQPGTYGVVGMFITPDHKLYSAVNRSYRVYDLE